MSLIACRECGKQISSDAGACPHCGKQAAPQPSGCFVAILVGLGLIAFGAMFESCNPNENNAQPIPTPDEARAACRTAIKLTLNDPESAQWDTGGLAAPNPDGSWTAHRTLRAKNAFGAYQRAKFECHIAPNGDGTWRGLSVREIEP